MPLMEIFSQIAELWLWADEGIGAALGIVVVLCLIRENVWAWPLGVAYVLVSVTVLLEARLYASLWLHLLGFLPMNLYGWYHWLYGGEQRDDLPVTRTSVVVLAAVGALCVVGALGFGWYLATRTNAAYAYWDSGILVMSLAAMWLTAHKKIDNWIVWLVVNVISVAVYLAQDLLAYAGLYSLYIPMAVWGYATWLRSMRDAAARNLA